MIRTESFAYDPLNSNRRHRIKLNKRGGYLVDNKNMPGLCKRLKSTFYPTFEAKYVCNRKRKRNTEDPLERGKRVDRELQLFIKNGIIDNFHPFTRKILTALKMWKFALKEAQVMIFDDKLNIATAVDLVYSRPKKEGGERMRENE